MMTTGRVKVFAGLAVLSLLAACKSALSLDAVGSAAPNPDGCYVQVWEGPDKTGLGDFINGPARLARLRDTPGRRPWRNRIGSLQLGERAASVTVWADEDFRGTSQRLTQVEYRRLPDGLSRRIESMEIACRTAAP
jgi:hypothetical protein